MVKDPPKQKICRYCRVPMEPDISSFADRCEPTAVYDDPKAAVPVFTGDWYCPKCRRINCWIDDQEAPK